MKIIPLAVFNSFKTNIHEKVYLFNKKIVNKVKKNNSIRKNSSLLKLYLNKINKENYLSQTKKFLGEKYITKSDLNEFTTSFFSLIISEDNFTEQYLLFYKTIIENYYNIHQYDFSYLVNLVESKFIIDFQNKKVLLGNLINKLVKIPTDINDNEKNNYINSYKKNNLKILHFMIKHKILDSKITTVIYNTLNSQNNYQFLYEFIKLNQDIQYLQNFYKNNINKLSLRLQTIFKELIKLLETKPTNLNTNIVKKTNHKISNKILIYNIIEEYLFLEDIDEVKTFIENHILTKNLQVTFVETVLNYGKKNNKNKEMTELLEKSKDVLKKKPVFVK